MPHEEERARLRSRLRPLEGTHQAVDVPRNMVADSLAEMEEPLGSGTLDAPGVGLNNTVAGRCKAELVAGYPVLSQTECCRRSTSDTHPRTAVPLKCSQAAPQEHDGVSAGPILFPTMQWYDGLGLLTEA
jgi:hypothetical protein